MSQSQENSIHTKGSHQNKQADCENLFPANVWKGEHSAWIEAIRGSNDRDPS